MSSPIRFDRDTAERLLDGELHDGSPLANLLDAARAPGRPVDLVGLDAARAQFLAARTPLAAQPAPRRGIAGRTARRVLAAKAIAAATGATLIGSAAFAASSHGLLDNSPAQHTRVVHRHPTRTNPPVGGHALVPAIGVPATHPRAAHDASGQRGRQHGSSPAGTAHASNGNRGHHSGGPAKSQGGGHGKHNGRPLPV